MRVLLDTDVISEIRHPKGDEAVKHRIAAIHPDALFVSAVVFAELTKGVLRLPKGRKRNELLGWLGRLESVYGDHILAFDRETARVWGKIVAENEAKGLSVHVSDGQIAATETGSQPARLSTSAAWWLCPLIRRMKDSAKRRKE
jgi:predicted nucleic acid-binding protein